MKTERLERTKTVVASSALALVVAALVFGLSSLFVKPSGSTPPGFALTANSSSFTISSNIYPSPACSGSTALLYPGLTRCMVFTVANSLSVPVTLQNISTTLPSPPAGCPASDFTLPTFTGSLTVPANGSVNTAGEPIALNDTGTNQDACEDVTLHFTYSGSAQYTDGTTIVLTTSPNPPTSGQQVTLSAKVSGDNPSIDPTPPSGTVTFYACTTAACTTKTMLGTGTIGANGVATLTLSSLPAGANYVEAVYDGSGTDYTASTSSGVTLNVLAAAPGSGSAAGNGSASGGNGVAAAPTGQAPAFTGADIAGMAIAGVVLIGIGTILVLAMRRRRRTSES